MTSLNHAATGALVAVAINRPAIALPAALLSHFVIDAIPHWDDKLKGGLPMRRLVLMIDITLALDLLIVLALTVQASHRLIILGGILGALPDAMFWQYFKTGKGRPIDSRKPMDLIRRFHLWIQWSETSWGKYVEAVWLVIILILIYQIQQ